MKEFEDYGNNSNNSGINLDDEIDSDTGLRKTNCNKLMALFLYLVSKNVT